MKCEERQNRVRQTEGGGGRGGGEKRERRGRGGGGSHCNLIWGGALSITSRAGPREEEAGML